VSTHTQPTGDSRAATRARYVTSYARRRAYAESPLNVIQYPPGVSGVTDFVDLHAHAHKQQQDGPALIRTATESGMRALLIKTTPTMADPMASVGRWTEDLARWADERELRPVEVYGGWVTEVYLGGLDPALVRDQLSKGVRAIWLPVASHANSIAQVGGRPYWWGATRSFSELVGPVPWEIARERGGYVIDSHGKLKPEVREIINLCAEFDALLSFGHLSKPEQALVADEVVRQNFKKAMFDHPLSPFVDLSQDEMVEYTRGGMWLNFTYDELSPLLGIDPAYMYECIRLVGPEHVTLSCDAGEPFFPNSVECMRLMSVYMGAFGLSQDELRQVCVDNGRYLLGLPG
jgi:hypothetical protein